MIPTWLQRQLETAGRWNTDGIGRGLSAGRCGRCKAPVVRGLDADIAGIPVTCDPQPVDNLGEALALIAGRGTYSARYRGRWELSPRNQWRIAARTPDQILAEHRCDTPPLPPGPPLTDPAARPTGDECPF